MAEKEIFLTIGSRVIILIESECSSKEVVANNSNTIDFQSIVTGNPNFTKMRFNRHALTQIVTVKKHKKTRCRPRP